MKEEVYSVTVVTEVGFMHFGTLCLFLMMHTIIGFRLPWRSPIRSRRFSSIAKANEFSANKPTIDVLKDIMRASLVKNFGAEFSHVDPIVQASRPEFGDYQCNNALSLTKQLKMKPRDISEKMIGCLEVGPNCVIESANVSGPGFINIKLSDDYLKSKALGMLKDRAGKLAVPPVQQPQKIVVDYSSPNIAKEMHVGHLRSTILGDSLSNIFDILGHKSVLRLNHIGDWGTQFGMLIQYMNQLAMEKNLDWKTTPLTISDLAAYYKSAKKCFDESEVFQEQAKQAVVRLQSGDETTLAMWRFICQVSRNDFQSLYQILEVNPNLQERGESFYNASLAGLVENLMACGVATESDGAKCIFLPPDASAKTTTASAGNSSAANGAKKGKEEVVIPPVSMDDEHDGNATMSDSDSDSPVVIIQKSDGGFLYSTTDLAALHHRVTQEKADHIVYVTDWGQSNHFRNIFSVAKRASASLFPGVHFWVGKADSAAAAAAAAAVDATSKANRVVRLTHVPFGVVTGEDGKRIKSRSGDTVRLRELLDEAVDRAAVELVERAKQRGTVLSDAEIREKSKIIGIAAIKYADLSFNRETNYRFSFTKMLSMTGNTAPYMLYSYARIQGIKKKVVKDLMKNPLAEGFDTDAMLADLVYSRIDAQSFQFGESEEEVALLKHILRLDETIYHAAGEMQPNYICDYMYELSQKFNNFYERCPVIHAPTEQLQQSRTVLCELTGGSIKLCLQLLGIKTVDTL